MALVSCGRPLVAKSEVGPCSLLIMVRTSAAAPWISFGGVADLHDRALAVAVDQALARSGELLDLDGGLVGVLQRLRASAMIALRSRSSAVTACTSLIMAGEPLDVLVGEDLVDAVERLQGFLHHGAAAGKQRRNGAGAASITSGLPGGVASFINGFAVVPAVIWM